MLFEDKNTVDEQVSEEIVNENENLSVDGGEELPVTDGSVTDENQVIPDITVENPQESTVSEEKSPAKDNFELPDMTDILALRAELDLMKKELEDTRAFFARLQSECEEFTSLYPEVSLSSINDTIWDEMKKGIPLSAAYALEVRRTEIKAKRADEANRKNSETSSGALTPDTHNDFFSPSQVKAMTAEEVRANYTKIINSMPKWY